MKSYSHTLIIHNYALLYAGIKHTFSFDWNALWLSG